MHGSDFIVDAVGAEGTMRTIKGPAIFLAQFAGRYGAV